MINFVQFRIIAEDVEGQSDSTFVHVTIINTNDNAPFLNVPEVVYIDESFDINQPVLNISAKVNKSNL